MFRTFKIPITWGELISRTFKDISADNVLGLAAQLAYYFLLALVPAMVSVVALASFFPSNLLQDIVSSMSGVAPEAIVEILREQLTTAAEGPDHGAFTMGLLLALWSSSGAILGITDALNRAYDIEEGRSWWKVRLVALGLTVSLAAFIVLAFGLILVGPAMAERLAATMGLGPTFVLIWKIVQWPVAFILIAVAIGIIYYFAPDAKQDWEWVSPGAVLATALWLSASLAFKIYVANFSDYTTYGSLGGVIVLMLWFYITGLAVLVGAEMNAEIEHASPHGKEPGEKVAGQKKKVGAAAARDYQERQRSGGSKVPVTKPSPGEPGATMQPARPGFAAYALLGAGIVKRFLNNK
ncbi:MAG TPA: YihY/virulence factor BrkB family protein [Vicinamibacterales bacterium]|nr:YihY/virulence factor BrkB family protein [Vicinamibacterales bacterium]